jgi:ribosome-binding protein aMBF1 (putative translation factor)
MLDSNDPDQMVKTDTVPEVDRKLINTLRMQKKLSQDQLNSKLSLKKDTIKDIESGKHPKNGLLVSKIKKFLTDYEVPQ